MRIFQWEQWEPPALPDPPQPLPGVGEDPPRWTTVPSATLHPQAQPDHTCAHESVCVCVRWAVARYHVDRGNKFKKYMSIHTYKYKFFGVLIFDKLFYCLTSLFSRLTSLARRASSIASLGSLEKNITIAHQLAYALTAHRGLGREPLWVCENLSRAISPICVWSGCSNLAKSAIRTLGFLSWTSRGS